jgi:hypothetical protein
MNEDYEVTSRDVRYQDKDVLATIMIRTGEYANVEFNFGEIHVDEDETAGTCTLRFNYDILSDHKQLEGNETFEEVLGEIMNDVLIESINAAEEKYRNELREKNTEAPNL